MKEILYRKEEKKPIYRTQDLCILLSLLFFQTLGGSECFCLHPEFWPFWSQPIILGEKRDPRSEWEWECLLAIRVFAFHQFFLSVFKGFYNDRSKNRDHKHDPRK